MLHIFHKKGRKSGKKGEGLERNNMADRDPRPKNKRRKPWNRLSKKYKQRLLAKYRGVYKAYGSRKPKGKRGMVAVKRLGRRRATGMFEKIARIAAKRYGSAERGRKVAAAVYWKKVRG